MPRTGLLLARYNQSMHLGQGFNSFLQVSCVDNAVTFDQSKIVVERDASPAGVSQVVSYSSRFVKKISDVVRSMNISAASIIKSGSIEASSSGNPFFVEEAKFASSDLNVVVSVKVMHQTTRLVDPVFQPIEHVQVNNDKFLDIYGDCYISGFIEGGELHGIVSINILDAFNKRDLEKMIQGQMNSMGSSDSQLASALSQTETTISVNWSRGSQHKPECEEWSIGTILQTAAAFPAKVSSCPRRTWAILTKYDDNRDFVQWADKNKVTIPQYQGIQAYTSNLLDTYMEYKHNIARLQAVLQSPKDYMMSSVSDAIPTSTAALIYERDKMRKQMGLIVKEIDILCIHPEKIEEIEGKSQIQSAEVWATRLPVQKGTSAGEERFREQVSTADVMESPLVSGTSPQASTVTGAASEGVIPIKIDPLCTPEVEAAMREHDRAFVTSSENKLKFQSYRFGMICGSADGNPFNDAVELQTALVPVTWPKRIEIDLIKYWTVEYPVVGCYKVYYDQFTLVRGSNMNGTVVQTFSMDMSYRELITRVKLAKNPKQDFRGVIYVEFRTNQGRWGQVGNLQGSHIIDERPPTGFLGLKGFYGSQGSIVDSMGAIWGQ